MERDELISEIKFYGRVAALLSKNAGQYDVYDKIQRKQGLALLKEASEAGKQFQKLIVELRQRFPDNDMSSTQVLIDKFGEYVEMSSIHSEISLLDSAEEKNETKKQNETIRLVEVAKQLELLKKDYLDELTKNVIKVSQNINNLAENAALDRREAILERRRSDLDKQEFRDIALRILKILEK